MVSNPVKLLFLVNISNRRTLWQQVKALAAHKDHAVLQVHKDVKAHLDHKVQPGLKARKVIPEHKVQADQDLQARKVIPEHKVCKDQKATLEHKAYKAFAAYKDRPVQIIILI
jgi:hypothetical protein